MQDFNNPQQSQGGFGAQPPAQTPQKKKMSTGIKILIAVVIVAVVGGADRKVSAERSRGERDEQAEPGEELRPVLAPGHPCHLSGTFSGGCCGVGSRSPVAGS